MIKTGGRDYWRMSSGIAAMLVSIFLFLFFAGSRDETYNSRTIASASKAPLRNLIYSYSVQSSAGSQNFLTLNRFMAAHDLLECRQNVQNANGDGDNVMSPVEYAAFITLQSKGRIQDSFQDLGIVIVATFYSVACKQCFDKTGIDGCCVGHSAYIDIDQSASGFDAMTAFLCGTVDQAIADTTNAPSNSTAAAKRTPAPAPSTIKPTRPPGSAAAPSSSPASPVSRHTGKPTRAPVMKPPTVSNTTMSIKPASEAPSASHSGVPVPTVLLPTVAPVKSSTIAPASPKKNHTTVAPATKPSTNSSTGVPATKRRTKPPTVAPTTKRPTNSTGAPATKRPTNSSSSTPATKRPTNSSTAAPATKRPTNSSTVAPATKHPKITPTVAPATGKPSMIPAGTPHPTARNEFTCIVFYYTIQNSQNLTAYDILNEKGTQLKTGLEIATDLTTVAILNTTFPQSAKSHMFQAGNNSAHLTDGNLTAVASSNHSGNNGRQLHGNFQVGVGHAMNLALSNFQNQDDVSDLLNEYLLGLYALANHTSHEDYLSKRQLAKAMDRSQQPGERTLVYFTDVHSANITNVALDPFCPSADTMHISCSIVETSVCVALEAGDNATIVEDALLSGFRLALADGSFYARVPPKYLSP
jgi:hypothetical protein